MVEHRRTPKDKVAVPAAWFIVASIVACAGAAGWLGVLLMDPTAASAEADTPVASSTPTPTPPASTTPSPEASPTTASPTPTEAPVRRESTVSVLNNTGISNLARSYSAQVTAAGWTVSGVGNWRGQIEANTVYFPDGLQDQAELLAADVGIARVLPSIVPMRMDRLTIILSGPQQ